MNKTYTVLFLLMLFSTPVFSATNTVNPLSDFAKSAVQAQKNQATQTAKNAVNQANSAKAKQEGIIKNQISMKEAQIKKINSDAKLTASQKKAKVTLIEKDIATLKAELKNLQK